MKRVLERYYPEQTIDFVVANHLRIQESDEELYQLARQSVINALQAAEDYTNRTIIRSIIEWYTPVPEDNTLTLPTAPVHEASVRVYNSDSHWTEINIELLSGDHIATILCEPDELAGADRLKVEYEAGYGDMNEEGPIPGAILQAVMLMAGTFMEYTADSLSGNTSELPTSAKALLHPYRIYPYGSL